MISPHRIVGALALALWCGAAAPAAWAESKEAKGSTIRGVEVFANTCGFCHQAGGRKAGRGPKLAGSERSDEYMFNRIKKGKRGRMPAYGGAFSEADIWAIIAYIRDLDAAGE